MYHAENISIIYYGPFQPKVPCYLHFLCITVLHLWIQPTVGREVLYLLGENPCTHGPVQFKPMLYNRPLYGVLTS